MKAADYLKRRINNNPSDNKKNLEDLRKKLYSTTKTLIQDLGWRDFELLVELLFSRTNWQKEDRVGGVEKTTDLKLFEPITRKNAFVQIKSAATQDIFDKYLIEHKGGAFKKMFFVYHTGHVRDYSGGEDVTIIGPEELGRRVIDAGLLDWLCDRVG